MLRTGSRDHAGTESREHRNAASRADFGGVDSTYAWIRLFVALVLGTIGSVGMWSYVVALPPVQADFGILRNAASLPYTMRDDRLRVRRRRHGPAGRPPRHRVPGDRSARCCSRSAIVGAGYAPNIWMLDAAHVRDRLSARSGTFGPIVSDMSHWFKKRRGVAIGIASCGNYLSGAVWPPIVQHFIDSDGWRATHIGIGIFCIVTMIPLTLMMRRPSPVEHAAARARAARRGTLGLKPNTLQALLAIAGIACCVAMAMPQVHIVAYCADLGYGVARGAEMLVADARPRPDRARRIGQHRRQDRRACARC